MPYEKLNLKNETVLTEEHLAHFEEGIATAVAKCEEAVSIQHEWDGTVLIVKSNSGESSADLKGKDGATGKSAYAYAQEGGYAGTEDEFAHKLAVPFITPEMYGALGDGATDDSTAIQAAIDAAGSETLVYLAKKTYCISTGLILSVSHSAFKCDGEIVYDGTDAAVTLKTISNANVYIDRITAANGTALKLDGSAGGHVLSNNVTVNYILSSVVGIYLYTGGTSSKSICYNEIYSNIIKSTETGLKVWCDAKYINDNRYHLGYIGGGCSKGIWLHSDSSLDIAGNYGTNENRFIHGSVEGVADGGCGIYLDNSCGNIFENFRLQENYGDYAVVFNGYCVHNDLQLSRLMLSRVDASGLTNNSINYLRAVSILANSSYLAGNRAMASYNHGITYDPRFANISLTINSTNFPELVIKQYDSTIPTYLLANSSSGTGSTYVLGGLYSEAGSMARGFPVVIKFSSSGKIILNDSKGNTIIDNTAGEYVGTYSIRWAGYDKDNGLNIWDITELGAEYVTTDDLTEAVEDGLATAKASGEFDGADGQDGADGTSVTVSSVSESTADGGSNVVTFSDGKTLTVKNGSKGSTGATGATGADGYTPVKGTDYWTDADKAEMVTAVKDALTTETWTFTLEDGSIVTKAVLLG